MTPRFDSDLLTEFPRPVVQLATARRISSRGHAVRLLSLVAVASTLGGCAPMVSSIYRPEVPGGELSRPMCGGRVGPKEIVTFAAGAVRVRMSAHGRSDGRVRVSVIYLVPSNVRLRLALDEFVVTEPGDGRTQHYRIGRLTHSTVEGKWEEVAAQSELIGRDVGPPGQRSPAPIFGAFTTEGPLPGVFEVQLPKALVDDAAIDFPKVLFRHAEEAWISPFNC